MEDIIKIIKRDGSVVDFDESRIALAIKSAVVDSNETVTDEIIEEIVDVITSQILSEEEELWDVESISDEVESQLMDYGLHKTARHYILYREERRKEREKEDEDDFEYVLLSKDFIEKYKHLPNPFPSALGEMVFYRTYSRWLSDKRRREYWWETVRRAVEYNCSLVSGTTKQEAEELFDNIYNLRQFLSGRTLYSGGTEVSKKFPMSNFNCSAVVVDDISAFHETLYMLLLGSGVGFRALKEDVDKLPKFNSKLEVINKNYTAVPKGKRKEHTELTFPSDNVCFITIGDSKSSWSMAIKYLMDIYTSNFYNQVQTVVVDYDNIRPYGEQLKTFGGQASGHTAIEKMIDRVSHVIEKRGEIEKTQYVKLQPIDVLDIETSLAEGVVVGGTRRSSLIGFAEKDDKDFLHAKQNLYVKNDKDIWEINEEILNRQLSNNTIFYHEKPTREELHEHMKAMRHSAEPAMLNAKEALRRNPNFKLTNPCGKFCLM